MRAALLVLVVLSACAKDLDRAALLDPVSCRECHPRQFSDWSSSMHAYAADDPVFRAMNARGQRESDGALGNFCVRCHAPMAVREGATTDGLNLDDVPQHLKGVTCFFCHQASEVERDHNNEIVLADDGILRGGIADPISSPAHNSQYSELHDRNRADSSLLCGSCHDVVNGQGVRLERTYREWRDSLYAKNELGAPLSCGSCHMSSSTGRAADVDGAPERRLHSHAAPGVDLAIIDWPGKEDQHVLVNNELFSVLSPEVCVDNSPAGAAVEVTFENIGAGHNFPSGATHNRRAWVEVRGFVGGDEVFSSGVIPEGISVDGFDDPNLWRLYNTLEKDEERTEDMRTADGVVGETLPAPTTTIVSDPAYFDPHITRAYFFPTPLPVDRVETRVHIRAIGLDVVDDLIATGDLDAGLRDAFGTLTLGGSEIAWTADLGTRCNPSFR